jgi:hypothetical protein
MDSLNMQYCMPPVERQLGFLIGWGDMMGARIGGNDLSTAYTSTTTACREITILRDWRGNQELGKFAGTISNSNLQAGN